MNFTLFKQLTRFEQTLFGLPFILSGALLPCITQQAQVHFEIRWLWILPAFMAARISGMAFNQVIDRYIDADNPRTQRRLIPSGIVSSRKAYVVATIFLLLFLFFCSQINLPTLYLSLFAAFLLVVYSYTKRVTSLSHFVLGMIHFLGSSMACIAITGTLTLVSLLFACISMMLIIGVDIIYALQDIKFDGKQGLHSLPVRLGIYRAQKVAQLAHFICVSLLVLMGLLAHFTLFYYFAPLLSSLALCFLHLKAHKELQREEQLIGFEPTFFYCTVIVSFSTLTFLLLQWIYS